MKDSYSKGRELSNTIATKLMIVRCNISMHLRVTALNEAMQLLNVVVSSDEISNDDKALVYHRALKNCNRKRCTCELFNIARNYIEVLLNNQLK